MLVHGERNRAMTRLELIPSLAQHFTRLTTEEAELSVAELLKSIKHALVSGERVETRGFGR